MGFFRKQTKIRAGSKLESRTNGNSVHMREANREEKREWHSEKSDNASDNSHRKVASRNADAILNISEEYKILMLNLEEDSKKQRDVVESLQKHLEKMEILDKSLTDKVEGFWKVYSNKIRDWLFLIKKKIAETNADIKTFQERMGTCEKPFKQNYQNLINIAKDNDLQWRNVGITIVTKVMALMEVEREIEKIQFAKQNSVQNLDKIIKDYYIYKRDVGKVIKECQILGDFETKIQNELDMAISEISPGILELVNDKIVENIRSIVPRAELLFAEAASFEGLVEIVGTETADILISQQSIVDNLKKAKLDTVDVKFKLKNIQIAPNELENKIHDVADMLKFDSGKLNSAKFHIEHTESNSYNEYREIMREKLERKVAIRKVYKLFDGKNDFRAEELDDVYCNFSYDYGLKIRLSKHDSIDARTLVKILQSLDYLRNSHFSNDSVKFFESLCEILINNSFWKHKFSRIKLSRSELEVISNCIEIYLKKFRITRKIFIFVMEECKGFLRFANKYENWNKWKRNVLLNTLLDEECFFIYLNYKNKHNVDMLVMNKNTPSEVLKKIAQNASYTTLREITRHPNVTLQIQRIIAKRMKIGP